MKLRSLNRILPILFFVIVLVGVPVFSADSPVLDRVLKNGVLKVGMSGNQAPMNVRNRSGQMMGLEVDLADILASAMDVKVQIINRPFSELLPALKAGEVDLVLSGMTITAKRTADVSFIGHYMVSGKSILTKSKTLAAANQAADIDKTSVSVTALEGSTSQSFVEKHLSQAKLVTSKDYDIAVKMVIDGQVDAMVADMPICILSVMRFPGSDLVTLSQPFTIEPFGIAVPANDLQFSNLIENYFRTLEGLGVMDELRKKWLDDGSWVAALP